MLRRDMPNAPAPSLMTMTTSLQTAIRREASPVKHAGNLCSALRLLCRLMFVTKRVADTHTSSGDA